MSLIGFMAGLAVGFLILAGCHEVGISPLAGKIFALAGAIIAMRD